MPVKFSYITKLCLKMMSSGLAIVLAMQTPANAGAFIETLQNMQITTILVLAAYAAALAVGIYYFLRVRYLKKKKQNSE